MNMPQQCVRKSAGNLALLVITTVSLFFGASAMALEFECQLYSDIRYLRVDIPGEDHLCEVSVKYAYTDERKVMWYADNDSLYCSARAYELKDKYENNLQFKCAKWPDRDGIDELSPSHRAILDLQLKILMTKGESAEEPFRVTAVKAAASTPLDHHSGMLALQFFLSDGSDQTQVIVDENDSWKIFANIDDMAAHVTGDAPVDAALITSITDGGALEVLTSLADGSDRNCQGHQVLMVGSGNQISARTGHRFLCDSIGIAAAEDD
jgi:hypothetical protein